jgi:hypothetical protein
MVDLYGSKARDRRGMRMIRPDGLRNKSNEQHLPRRHRDTEKEKNMFR